MSGCDPIVVCCRRCGRTGPGRLATSTSPDLCRNCLAYERKPKTRCRVCGTVTVKRIRPGHDGDVCDDCVPGKHERVCGVYGRVGRLAVRATDTSPAVGDCCYRPPVATCSRWAPDRRHHAHRRHRSPTATRPLGPRARRPAPPRGRGLRCAPHLLRIDEHGCEVLTYIDGKTIDSSPVSLSDGRLVSAAQLIRRFHDTSAGTALVQTGRREPSPISALNCRCRRAVEASGRWSVPYTSPAWRGGQPALGVA